LLLQQGPSTVLLLKYPKRLAKFFAFAGLPQDISAWTICLGFHRTRIDFEPNLQKFIALIGVINGNNSSTPNLTHLICAL
jgi:hypothetical protein